MCCVVQEVVREFVRKLGEIFPGVEGVSFLSFFFFSESNWNNRVEDVGESDSSWKASSDPVKSNGGK